MRVVLTGFGRFQGVDENPTTELVEALRGRKDVICSQVLTVAGLDVERFAADVIAENRNIPGTLFLHLGVAGRRNVISLERNAKNQADFRCADERQWEPVAECIRGDDYEHVYQTSLNVDSLVRDLEVERFPVVCSDDAGEFLCNMIYYLSCRLTDGRKDVASLFVHVPPFDKCPKDVQIAAISSLIEKINEWWAESKQ